MAGGRNAFEFAAPDILLSAVCDCNVDEIRSRISTKFVDSHTTRPLIWHHMRSREGRGIEFYFPPASVRWENQSAGGREGR